MTTQQTCSDVLEEALGYARRGWRVIPLHHPLRPPGREGCSCHRGANCSSPGKHPRVTTWQKTATTDEEVISDWWRRWPAANLGVVFGRDSGLVDFECDSPEEEKALGALFGGEPPVTLCYRSHRGKHWLFQWRDDLPDVAALRVAGVGLRIGGGEKGAMSAFPPSLHAAGDHYRWLVGPDEAILQPIPDAVLARICNWSPGDKEPETTARQAQHWERILNGVPEGVRNESAASLIGKLLRGADLKEPGTINVLYQTVRTINADRFKPPLAEKELRATFLSLLKREENRRTSEQFGPALKQPPEKQLKGDKLQRGMRLVIVRSDPPTYELYADQFGKAARGCLVLTAAQLTSIPKLRQAALEQADYPLPRNFGRLWEGTSKIEGLYDLLVFHAEERDAPPEQKRRVVVAELLAERLRQARPLREGRQLSETLGYPAKLDNGCTAFRFTTVWVDLNQGADRVTRNELSDVLEQVGAGQQQFGRQRFRVVSDEQIERLTSDQLSKNVGLS